VYNTLRLGQNARVLTHIKVWRRIESEKRRAHKPFTMHEPPVRLKRLWAEEFQPPRSCVLPWDEFKQRIRDCSSADIFTYRNRRRQLVIQASTSGGVEDAVSAVKSAILSVGVGYRWALFLFATAPPRARPCASHAPQTPIRMRADT
jgi:hypothetical protein